MRFAAIIPVGFSAIDRSRSIELVESLLGNEPGIGWCVILDDSPFDRGLSRLTLYPSTCQAITILNSLRELPRGRVGGGLAAEELRALSWIHANTDADFVLKIDVDALVIAPFASSIRSIMNNSRDVGLIGAVGGCNEEFKEFRRARLPRLSPIVAAHKSWPRSSDCADGRVESPVQLSKDRNRRFEMVRTHIEAAIKNGYEADVDCQGGAYIITRSMIDKMSFARYLARPHSWTGLPFGEDQIMAMYAHAVGCGLLDYSGRGEVFGVQATGLGYPPNTLLDRGYSIIHSVKNSRLHSENDIRAYFKNRLSRIANSSKQ